MNNRIKREGTTLYLTEEFQTINVEKIRETENH
jgi:hypothetical protein